MFVVIISDVQTFTSTGRINSMQMSTLRWKKVFTKGFHQTDTLGQMSIFRGLNTHVKFF